MTERARQSRMLREGLVELRSPFFSNAWRVVDDRNETLALARRYPRSHLSRVVLNDRTVWTLEPEGWGVVRAVEDEVPFAHATRQSWTGRQWEVGGVGFAYELRPVRLVVRRWALLQGNEPLVHLRGGFLTYNRLRAEVVLPVPLVAVLLAWHVMARPWEAAAAPRLVLTGKPARPWPAG